jgi:hypothetical protein
MKSCLRGFSEQLYDSTLILDDELTTPSTWHTIVRDWSHSFGSSSVTLMSPLAVSYVPSSVCDPHPVFKHAVATIKQYMRFILGPLQLIEYAVVNAYDPPGGK